MYSLTLTVNILNSVDGETLLSREGTTQGDPLAMAMYAIAIVPLIHRLQHEVIQVWYVDDATAGGKLANLRSWCDQLVQCGHEYGYHTNANKLWLVVKEEHLTQAKELFAILVFKSLLMGEGILVQLWAQDLLRIHMSAEKCKIG